MAGGDYSFLVMLFGLIPFFFGIWLVIEIIRYLRRH